MWMTWEMMLYCLSIFLALSSWVDDPLLCDSHGWLKAITVFEHEIKRITECKDNMISFRRRHLFPLFEFLPFSKTKSGWRLWEWRSLTDLTREMSLQRILLRGDLFNNKTIASHEAISKKESWASLTQKVSWKSRLRRESAHDRFNGKTILLSWIPVLM
jgi:hypothetical protein